MKEKKNYIDNIPKINDMKWDVSEDGIVEITVENTGFYNTIAQKIFKKPRYSFIKLDEVLCGRKLMERKVFMRQEKNFKQFMKVQQHSYMKDYHSILQFQKEINTLFLKNKYY